MISQFPDIYPDELLYSQLARYYIRTGYTAYIYAAEDLFEMRTIRPDIEFISPLNDGVKEILTRNKDFNDIIRNHTMFPYYARFLNKERRNTAYESLLEMKGNLYNLIAVPKNEKGQKRYLRYCPLCAKEDREKYAETYWRRIHQMIGIDICPVHGCYLINSDVEISSRASPALKTAEEKAVSKEIIMSNSEVEKELCKYVMNVFQSDMNFDDTNIGKYLHSQMTGTKYCSVRGKQRNMEKLCLDFKDKFNDLDCNFKESWQLQKVLNGYRTNTKEVCMLAMFLGITPEELVEMKLPDISPEELFDKKVKELHMQGFKYPEIAKRLNASYNIVKPIGEDLYGSYTYRRDNPKQKVSQCKDWTETDIKTLPLVREAIKKLRGDGYQRPKKVTVYAVEKLLNLPSKRIYYLPLCKAEILKYQESQEEYWAREVVWAVNKLKHDNVSVTITRIKQLTNMRDENFKACMGYLADIIKDKL